MQIAVSCWNIAGTRLTVFRIVFMGNLQGSDCELVPIRDKQLAIQVRNLAVLQGSIQFAPVDPVQRNMEADVLTTMPPVFIEYTF